MKSSLLADDSAAGLPAVAQPVAQLAASPQPAALPVAVMTGVSVSSTVGVADTHHIQAPQLVQAHAQHLGHFSSGLCDCCTDCNICCTTWCCPFIGIGQLAQRYSPLKANGTKAYKCKVVAVVLGFAMLLNYILSYVARTQYMDDIRTLVYACSPDVSVYHQRAVNNPELCQAGFSIFSNMMAVTSISGLISAFIFFASCFTIMTIRSKIRKAQRIAPTCCDDGCDDCCGSRHRKGGCKGVQGGWQLLRPSLLAARCPAPSLPDTIRLSLAAPLTVAQSHASAHPSSSAA